MDIRSLRYKIWLTIGTLMGSIIGYAVAPSPFQMIWYMLGGALVGLFMVGGIIHLFMGTRAELSRKEEKDPKSIFVVAVCQALFGYIGWKSYGIMGFAFGALFGAALAAFLLHTHKESEIKKEKDRLKKEAFKKWVMENSK